MYKSETRFQRKIKIWFLLRRNQILNEVKTMTDSILDRIIMAQKKEAIEHFNLRSFLLDLFHVLDEREQRVLMLRNGLLGQEKKYTLESIGKILGVTRERVRQIEAQALQKVRSSDAFLKKKKVAYMVIEALLDEEGGIMSEERLRKKFSEVMGGAHDAFLIFILNKLLMDDLFCVKADNVFVKSWALPSFSLARVRGILDRAAEIFRKKQKIMPLSRLWDIIKKDESLNKDKSLTQEILNNYLCTSAQLGKNPFGECGMKDWPLVSPRRMNDKIFLVLKHAGVPLHFTDITHKINEAHFDHKRAHAATVHNELILDSSRYVLIGRGIYALKEWGYKKGVVADVMEDTLRAHGPLTKKEIIGEVLKKRMVQPSTITLLLTNKDRFVKLPDGRYDILK